MTAARIYRSPAKINWYLRVLGARPDGYHEIETVFQELDLCDELAVEPTSEDRCIVTGLPPGIDPADNLITRAHALLRQECGSAVGGVRIHVTKRIPAAGGLGGGSSNAAATLKAVNDAYGLGLSATELETLGARLGSDIPFFIRGGCAIGTGRGEHLAPIAAALRAQLLLVIPPEPMPTAESYRLLDATPNRPPAGPLEHVVTALESGDEAALARAIHNDFDIIAETKAWYQAIRATLSAAGASRIFLCGSGSTVASFFGPDLSLESVLPTWVTCRVRFVPARAVPFSQQRGK
ncbi:MAG: 4-(cytidine 5'-diphospho)-2-C-methyl-D-erythritol kinase [Candidatus Sumerlaeaceae bacterium]|nr:4-(cytidine 5'-diphospho)-2-C-methyl-D-erythritol kinase [Candidatus Sumerlaeaceae bacterium]